MKRFIKIYAFVLLAFCVVNAARAQSGARKKKPDAKIANNAEKPPVARETPLEIVPANAPVKKNGRPDANEQTSSPQRENQAEKTFDSVGASKNDYVYEFSQPNFTVKRIVIAHDESGRGTISFEKKDYGEPVSDPLQLSGATLEKLRNLYRALNFLDSTENYQSPERDYSHLGTVKIERREGGKNRTAEFNWTENAAARSLADEYRRIGNQWIWTFDISLSRENQPLEAPGLMDVLDALVKRGEISDPVQMLPFLRELANDERIPLMARNRVAKIVREIEKKAAK